MKKIIFIVTISLFSVLLTTDNVLSREIWFPGQVSGSYWTYDFGDKGELTLTLGFTDINGVTYGVLKEQGLDLGDEDPFSLSFYVSTDGIAEVESSGIAIADTQNKKFLEWLKNFVRNDRGVLQLEDFLKNEGGIKEPIVGVHGEIKNLYEQGQRKLVGFAGALPTNVEGVVKDSDGKKWYYWEVLKASATVEFSNEDSHTEDVVLLGKYAFDSPEPIMVNKENKIAYSLSYFLYYEYANRKDSTPISEFPVWNLKIVPGIGVVNIQKTLNGEELFNGSLKSYQIAKGQSVDSNGKIATTWGNIKK